jgi:hypothetical protein
MKEGHITRMPYTSICMIPAIIGISIKRKIECIIFPFICFLKLLVRKYNPVIIAYVINAITVTPGPLEYPLLALIVNTMPVHMFTIINIVEM